MDRRGMWLWKAGVELFSPLTEDETWICEKPLFAICLGNLSGSVTEGGIEKLLSHCGLRLRILLGRNLCER